MAPLVADSTNLGDKPFQNTEYPCYCKALKDCIVFSFLNLPILVFHTSKGIPKVAASAIYKTAPTTKSIG